MVEVVEDQALLIVSLRLAEIVVYFGDVVALGLPDLICNVCVVFGVVLHTWVLVAFAHEFIHGGLFVSLSKLLAEGHCLLGLKRSQELNVA
jgi:hypothetical protein